MPDIVPPYSNEPITDKNGVMTQTMQIWVENVTRLDPIIGSGAPEGVVESVANRLYIDTTGSAGSILYVKKLADIGGDNRFGWVAV